MKIKLLNNYLKFIVLEGNDASGKSTLIQLIKQHYEKSGKKVKHIHFPMYGYSIFSDLISKFLRGEFGDLNSVDPLFIANIYAMDRFKYKEQLIEDLKNYDIILMDRYVFSNLAFTGAKVDDLSKVDDMIDWILKYEFDFLELPYPDAILYLDVPIDTIEERLNMDRVGDDRDYLNGKKDIHESDIEFQNRVRNIYLSLSNALNYFVIKTYNENGDVLNPEQLFDKINNLMY